jgi:hypothetical protein
MRRLLRPLLIFLAILFLIEAWLWDRLEPIVARAVAAIPLKRMKAAVAGFIADVPPWGALAFFLVPMLLLLPLKALEFWLFYRGAWIAGVGALILAKLFFLGITAFVFDITRDKLLQLGWFRALYDYVIWLREAARALTDPLRQRILRRMRMFTRRNSSGIFRLMMRIRRRMQPQSAP